MENLELDKIKKLAGIGTDKTDLARRTVTANGIFFSTEDRAFSRKIPQTWNVEIETSAVTNQKSAGICWLFASLNLLRHKVEKSRKIKNLEFSENYLLFFDKLEKANVFLENVWEFREKAVGARENDFLRTPIEDGGYFLQAADLIDKYGIMPKNVMPSSENAADSKNLNEVLSRILWRAVRKIREIPTREKMEIAKTEILADVYRVLSISLGEPPKKFAWSFRDDKKRIQKFSGTPKDFAKWLKLDKIREKYVEIMDSPALPYGKIYADRVVWCITGEKLPMLNLPMSEIKPLILKQLREKEGVPADISTKHDMTVKNQGVMDQKVYDLENLFGVRFDISRKDRKLSREPVVDHAVLIVGADAPHGVARWYKVENSWGEKVGDGGFWAMSENWADEFLANVAIRRDLLPEKIAKMFEQKPIEIDWWEEFGD